MGKVGCDIWEKWVRRAKKSWRPRMRRAVDEAVIPRCDQKAAAQMT